MLSSGDSALLGDVGGIVQFIEHAEHGFHSFHHREELLDLIHGGENAVPSAEGSQQIPSSVYAFDLRLSLQRTLAGSCSDHRSWTTRFAHVQHILFPI